MFLGMQDFDFAQIQPNFPKKFCWEIRLHSQLLRHRIVYRWIGPFQSQCLSKLNFIALDG